MGSNFPERDLVVVRLPQLTFVQTSLQSFPMIMTLKAFLLGEFWAKSSALFLGFPFWERTLPAKIIASCVFWQNLSIRWTLDVKYI